MAQGEIEFWFSIGSTYTYIAVQRVDVVARAAGVAVAWRPFNLRAILGEMRHVPFADKPSKMAYMWRDLERRAAAHGIPVRVPAPYPLKDVLLANKIALLGMAEGWGPDLVRASYQRWFHQGQEPATEPSLGASLREAGQDPVRVVAWATGPEADRQLAAQTDLARALGVFGAPTFVVDGELFWGNDRLDDAISWRKSGKVVL